jgi:hypothetical protein
MKLHSLMALAPHMEAKCIETRPPNGAKRTNPAGDEQDAFHRYILVHHPNYLFKDSARAMTEL